MLIHSIQLPIRKRQILPEHGCPSAMQRLVSMVARAGRLTEFIQKFHRLRDAQSLVRIVVSTLIPHSAWAATTRADGEYAADRFQSRSRQVKFENHASYSGIRPYLV